MDETVLAQSVSSDRSTITDSNNRGNAGRDIIHNYGIDEYYKGKVPRQIDIIPQFRSIIPCEVLLYIEVTFLDLSIDMGIFWGSWFLHSHKIPHPNQWGI